MKNLIGIFVCMLLIASTVSPVTGIINNNENNIITQIEGDPEPQFDATSRDDEWPQFKHDFQNTGYINSTGPQTKKVEWAFKFYYHGKDLHEAYPSPIIANGKVYMGSNNEIFHCLDAYTGQELWKYNIPGGTSSACAAVYKGKVYQSAVYNYTYCWNATTGELIWKHDEGYGFITSLHVHEGKVYHLRDNDNSKGKLYCLDAEDGTELWSYYFGTECYSSPALYKGKVYIGSGRGNMIYCFDAQDGSILWNRSTMGLAYSSPAVVNGKVYVGGGLLWCLNATTGDEIWSYSFNKNIQSSPSVANGKVYISCRGTNCLDAETGELLWNNPIGGSLYPAVSNDYVYVGKTKHASVICLDAKDGTKLWEYKKVGYPGHPIGPPVLSYGRLYVCGGSYVKPVLHCFKDPSQPPTEPIITGPQECIRNYQSEFMFNSIDPEGDDINYYIDWGDGTSSGWIGPYLSGQSIVGKHTWTDVGDYEIRVRAEDIYSVNSSWSEHTVTVIDAPALEIQQIKNGLFRTSTMIKNVGRKDASDVAWNITLDGGFILSGKNSHGIIDYIPIGEEAPIKSNVIFGFGKVLVAVTATVSKGISDSREQIGSVFLFFIKFDTSG